MSSVWGGIKVTLSEITPRSQWVVANGEKIDMWRDNWLQSASIKSVLNLSSHNLRGCTAKPMKPSESREPLSPGIGLCGTHIYIQEWLLQPGKYLRGVRQ
ncbi:hypothetical protein IFM89_013057 [Coptis chinensis]|uniref:Uncharacterized protein n=1 Tax=Coptis chinensis TaxID=261450 RepID=A0A835HM64_9MAGN|nr:hypothetical protein IFM89_013057 [Coptis chinensis]